MEWFEYHCLITYTALTLIPLFFLFFALPKGDQVNPEILNGLLTASSIIFGFALAFVSGRKRNLIIDLMFTVDLTLLSLCGFFTFFFGLHFNNGLPSLVFAASSLNANAVTASYSRFLERSERIEQLKKSVEGLQKK